MAATTQGWAVSFGGTLVPFTSRAEAKRFIKTNKKDVTDLRGGTFKAVIVRIPAHETGKGVIH